MAQVFEGRWVRDDDLGSRPWVRHAKDRISQHDRTQHVRVHVDVHSDGVPPQIEEALSRVLASVTENFGRDFGSGRQVDPRKWNDTGLQAIAQQMSSMAIGALVRAGVPERFANHRLRVQFNRLPSGAFSITLSMHGQDDWFRTEDAAHFPTQELVNEILILA